MNLPEERFLLDQSNRYDLHKQLLGKACKIAAQRGSDIERAARKNCSKEREKVLLFPPAYWLTYHAPARRSGDG